MTILIILIGLLILIGILSTAIGRLIVGLGIIIGLCIAFPIAGLILLAIVLLGSV